MLQELFQQHRGGRPDRGRGNSSRGGYDADRGVSRVEGESNRGFSRGSRGSDRGQEVYRGRSGSDGNHDPGSFYDNERERGSGERGHDRGRGFDRGGRGHDRGGRGFDRGGRGGRGFDRGGRGQEREAYIERGTERGGAQIFDGQFRGRGFDRETQSRGFNRGRGYDMVGRDTENDSFRGRVYEHERVNERGGVHDIGGHDSQRDTFRGRGFDRGRGQVRRQSNFDGDMQIEKEQDREGAQDRKVMVSDSRTQRERGQDRGGRDYEGQSQRGRGRGQDREGRDYEGETQRGRGRGQDRGGRDHEGETQRGRGGGQDIGRDYEGETQRGRGRGQDRGGRDYEGETQRGRGGGQDRDRGGRDHEGETQRGRGRGQDRGGRDYEGETQRGGRGHDRGGRDYEVETQRGRGRGQDRGGRDYEGETQRGRGRGQDRGGRDYDGDTQRGKGFDRERGQDRGTYRGRGSYRGIRGTEEQTYRGNTFERGGYQRGGRGSDRGSEKGQDRDSERGGRSSDRGSDRMRDRDSEKGSRDPGRKFDSRSFNDRGRGNLRNSVDFSSDRRIQFDKKSTSDMRRESTFFTKHQIKDKVDRGLSKNQNESDDQWEDNDQQDQQDQDDQEYETEEDEDQLHDGNQNQGPIKTFQLKDLIQRGKDKQQINQKINVNNGRSVDQKINIIPNQKINQPSQQKDQVASRFYRDNSKIEIIKNDRSILRDSILEEDVQENRSQNTQQSTKSGQRSLGAGAYRMLSFEIRKNDSNLPRDSSRPTVRDQEGKRIEKAQFRPKTEHPKIDLRQENKSLAIKEPSNFLGQQSEIQILSDKQSQISNTEDLVSQKRKALKMKIMQKIEKESNQTKTFEQQKINFSYGIPDYDLECSSISSEIFNPDENLNHGFSLVDKMITIDEIQIQEKLQYDKIFEVDQFTGDFDPSQAITAYFRSNQGKENKSIRSVKGIELAVNYLLNNIINCDCEEKPKYKKQYQQQIEQITYLDIFQYADDRFRAIQNDLTKLQARIDINHQMVPILEKISKPQIILIRFYIVSLFQLNFMKFSASYYGDDLKQIDDGIKKSIAAFGQYLITLFECYLKIMEEMKLVKEYMKRKKTNNLSKDQIQDMIQNKFNLLISPNISEFIQYLYLSQILKQTKSFTTNNGKISEITANLAQSCPFYEELLNFDEMILVNLLQECLITKNMMKIIDILNSRNYGFHSKFLISLIIHQQEPYYEASERVYQSTSDSIYESDYYISFEQMLDFLSVEFFQNSHLPISYGLIPPILQSRAIYIKDSLDGRKNFKDRFLKVILRQEGLQQDVSAKAQIIHSYQDEIESGEVENQIEEEVIVYKSNYQHVYKKWQNIYQRVKISDYLSKFFAPLYDDLDKIEAKVVNLYIKKWRFSKWKMFFYQSKKEQWFKALTQESGVNPIIPKKIDFEIVSQIVQKQQEKTLQNNILYNILEQCIIVLPHLETYHYKYCFILSSIDSSSDFQDLYFAFIDKMFGGLLQRPIKNFLLQFQEPYINTVKTIKIHQKETTQILLLSLVFIKQQTIEQSYHLLHGCDQLVFISSDNLQKDKQFFTEFKTAFKCEKIPLNLLIIFPTMYPGKYLNMENLNSSMHLSSANQSYSENQIENFYTKKDLLKGLGLLNHENNTTLFQSVYGIRFKLSKVNLYSQIFESYKFKKQFLQTLKFALSDKVKLFKQYQPQIPKVKLVSLSQVFQGLSTVVMSKLNSHDGSFFSNSIQNNSSFKSLVALCDFVEKCFEDLLETHLKWFVLDSSKGVLINAIPYDIQFSTSKGQVRFVRVCKSKVLSLTKNIMIKLNPANLIMKRIIQLIKKSLQNLNGADFLNFVRSIMKLCDKITKQKQFSRIKFAGYQRFFETQFKFGSQDKNFLEGNWVEFFLILINDMSLLLKSSKIYFIVPHNYEFTVDEEKLQTSIQDDYQAYLKDLEIIKQRSNQIMMKRNRNEVMDNNMYNYEFEEWLQKKKLYLEMDQKIM